MRGIELKAKNEKGINALKKNFEDRKKETVANRFLYKQAYKEEQLNNKEGVVTGLRIFPKTRIIAAESVALVAHDMMKQNGAEKKDYTLKYIEEGNE